MSCQDIAPLFAEKERFELPVGFHPRRFSKPLPSTTRPLLHGAKGEIRTHGGVLSRQFTKLVLSTTEGLWRKVILLVPFYNFLFQLFN